jgi:hypothetical protein
VLEVVFYAWGVLGIIGCLLLAQQAVEFQGNLPGILQSAALYTLIWLGGLVFAGLFALLAPVKVFLVNVGAPPENVSR